MIAANYVNRPVNGGLIQIATANTNRDGTGTMGTLLTAGKQGSRVERVRVKATTTTTAGMVRFFVSDGTNTRLLSEVAVTAITPSATVATFEADLSAGAFPLVLQADQQLRVSTHNAEAFNITITEGGDF